MSCSGDTNGKAGSRQCFFAQQVALSDDMVFRLAFSGNAVQALEPHVKVEFVDSAGKTAAEVPEPRNIALLPAGLGLMGLVAQRKRHG
jgi:hypothetical protein